MKLVPHRYGEDCVFLLKDLTDLIQEVTVEEKEQLIEQGVSYSEMISKEAIPSREMMELFKRLVEEKGPQLGEFTAQLAEKLWAQKGSSMIVVSLARAGTPFGVLIKHYLEKKYQVTIPHYSVSIIRGKGIDENALKHILIQHPNGQLQFVDGWTGKGSIINELENSIDNFNHLNNTNIDARLAVLADPAKRCEFYGTRQDLNIPNCCLNATVSGLISRTLHRESLVLPHEFHGAKYLRDLEETDVSMWFIEQVGAHFNDKKIQIEVTETVNPDYAVQITEEVAKDYQVRDIHKIKLSIGEAMRVLLRRKARVLLLKDSTHPDVQALVQLATEKGVPIESYAKGDYQAIAIIEERGEVYV